MLRTIQCGTELGKGLDMNDIMVYPDREGKVPHLQVQCMKSMECGTHSHIQVPEVGIAVGSQRLGSASFPVTITLWYKM